MCKLVGKIIEVMLNFLQYILYLLQINLFLWSKNPQIPRYILLTVFQDRNVSDLLAVWVSLLGLPQEEASSFTFSWISSSFEVSWIIPRFEGTWAFCTEETEPKVDCGRSPSYLHDGVLMAEVMHAFGRGLGWAGWGSYFHLMVANVFKSHGLGN